MPESPRPPRAAHLLLRFVLHRHDVECALSDLDEEFILRCARDGPSAAARWYRSQARRSVWPAILRRWNSRRDHAVANPTTTAATRHRLGSQLASELHWAWRGVRGRGGAGVFQVALVGVALAASALVFSATDAFVFRPAPYPNADRLVVLQRTMRAFGVSDYVEPGELEAWRSQTDLFSAFHAHDAGPTLHVVVGGVTEPIRTHHVTPGFLEMLGTIPRWGRPFVMADVQPDALPVAIVSKGLAERLFGEPARAIEQTFTAGTDSWRIVGVMPGTFRFPTATQEVWRPFAPRSGTPEWARRSVSSLALVSPDFPIDAIGQAVATRSPSIMAGVPRVMPDVPTTVASLAEARRDPHALLFSMLLGAASCLLLIACLNVASLELAGVVRRARAYTIQAVLGATRATLVRTALFEGGVLTAGAVMVAVALMFWGTSALPELLPAAMRNGLSNPIDLDSRTLAFIAVVAMVTWMVIVAPVAWRAWRTESAGTLNSNGRTSTVSRSQAFARHVLMTGQVALTVLLLVGGLLFVRSYNARVNEDKGFDSTNLVSVELLLPADLRRSPRAGQIESELLDRLRAHPSVQSISRADVVPPSTRAGIAGVLQIHGWQAPAGEIKIAGRSVDPEYFDTLGLRLQQGRWFVAGDSPGTVVVDEWFARRFWPNGDVIGARFGVKGTGFGGASIFEVVGVASHVRGDSIETPTGAEVHVMYAGITPNYFPLTFVVRLATPEGLASVTSVARAAAEGSVVRTTLIDEHYARLYGDTRIAAGITSVFAVVAFVVAIAGVYGVIAFLVAGRTREIGIRLAIGASGRSIQGLVLAPALLFIAAGIAAGMVGALAAARSIESHLFGITATDPGTYALVGLAVTSTALFATWVPARRAALIDPAITLRAE